MDTLTRSPSPATDDANEKQSDASCAPFEMETNDPPLSIAVDKSPSPSDSKVGDASTHCLRLICNLCNLCNVATSGISAYISLEALAWERAANGALDDVPVAYDTPMHDQVLTLEDMCKNLKATKAALMQSETHVGCTGDAAYETLIAVATRIPQVVGLVSTYDALVAKDGVKAERFGKGCALNREVIEQIRKGCDELTGLCVGDSEKEIVGWKDCFVRVRRTLER